MFLLPQNSQRVILAKCPDKRQTDRQRAARAGSGQQLPRAGQGGQVRAQASDTPGQLDLRHHPVAQYMFCRVCKLIRNQRSDGKEVLISDTEWMNEERTTY